MLSGQIELSPSTVEKSTDWLPASGVPKVGTLMNHHFLLLILVHILGDYGYRLMRLDHHSRICYLGILDYYVVYHDWMVDELLVALGGCCCRVELCLRGDFLLLQDTSMGLEESTR